MGSFSTIDAELQMPPNLFRRIVTSGHTKETQPTLVMYPMQNKGLHIHRTTLGTNHSYSQDHGNEFSPMIAFTISG